MKCSIIGSRIGKNDLDIYEKIKKLLQENNHLVDFSYFDRSLSEDISNVDKVYERNKKIIQNCDLLIAEVSSYSTGVGYLIGNALALKKPVLVLFDKKKGNVPSVNLKSSSGKSKLFEYKEYSSDKELEKALKSFLQKAKTLIDTKFILIISPEIDRYLEWAGENRRMHKAQLVRNALEDAIRKDKEYKLLNT